MACAHGPYNLGGFATLVIHSIMNSLKFVHHSSISMIVFIYVHRSRTRLILLVCWLQRLFV
jgi:hypothetical protein